MISDGKFPKKERLLKTGEFRRVYKEGRSFRKDFLALYVVANRTETNKVGIVASGRAIRRATKRNRIKRLLRESYRRSKHRLKQGFDIVLSAKGDFPNNISYNEIESYFLNLAKNAGIAQ